MNTKDEYYFVTEDEYVKGPYKTKQLATDAAKKQIEAYMLETDEQEEMLVVKVVAKVKARSKGGNEVWVEE